MNGRQQTDGSLALKQNNVIVIEAAQRTESQKLRVAAYCRVSSDSSDQLNSFVAQLNRYTALISSKENWALVDLYADEGISGTSAEKRPDFQRLISDCRRGLVDKVLVKSISRFARNTKDCLETIRELKTIGVGVYFKRWPRVGERTQKAPASQGCDTEASPFFEVQVLTHEPS